MNTRLSSAGERRRIAREAMDALGQDRRCHVRLRVQCSRSHHVATVYETDRGLVFRSVTAAHAHGSRDFFEVSHHDNEQRGRVYIDLLEVDNDLMADDGLAAGCECGPRTLSRSELLRAIADGERRVNVL